MKKFKLGFGPMSKEIIKILAKNSKENNYPLMIIASRNQVDHNTGYVCTTQELVDQLKEYRHENLLICRDHCGPYFADADKGLSVVEAIERCKDTILEDIRCGFDLIHIDVSRIPERQLDYAKELIEFTLGVNPDILLEFGSEDNTGIDLSSSIGRLDPQLSFLQKYKDSVKFFVTQTGSLTKNGQSGTFDVAANQTVAKTIHDAGFLFKEHNADYFTEEDIQRRIEAGVDSLNIAPQLGKVQTEVLKEFAPEDLWVEFSNYVYSQNFWQRWLPEGVTDMDAAVLVSGHYCYNSPYYKKILESIDNAAFNAILEKRIVDLLDHYKSFDHENEEVKFQLILKRRLEEIRRRDPFIYR